MKRMRKIKNEKVLNHEFTLNMLLTSTQKMEEYKNLTEKNKKLTILIILIF